MTDPGRAGRRSDLPPAPAGWRVLTVGAAAATLGLIVLGGIVRITGSGMGCGDDWPLCNGHLFPPMDLPTLIEYGHRLAAVAVSVLVVGVAVAAWRRERRGASPGARNLALGAVALLGVQVMLGAVTVWLELPPASVVLHLTTAMLLLAVLVALAADAAREGRPAAGDVVHSAGTYGITAASVLAFAVILLGALVANADAAPACQGFPLCNGEWWPERSRLAQLHWLHRLSAYALAGWTLALPALARRAGAPRRVRAALGGAAALAAGQIAVGAWMVMGGLPLAARAAHVGVGTALFAALVAGARLGRPLPRPAAAAAGGLHGPGAGARGSEPARAAGAPG